MRFDGSSATLWTLTDHLNTVRDLAVYDPECDATTIVNHIVYDAFGRVTSQTDPTVGTLFGFTARPFDRDTGLQNNLNRWYDAETGTWISEDPKGFAAADANLYRYVGTQVTMWVDPRGLAPPQYTIEGRFILYLEGTEPPSEAQLMFDPRYCPGETYTMVPVNPAQRRIVPKPVRREVRELSGKIDEISEKQAAALPDQVLKGAGLVVGSVGIMGVGSIAGIIGEPVNRLAGKEPWDYYRTLWKSEKDLVRGLFPEWTTFQKEKRNLREQIQSIEDSGELP